jgi:hypothetical protein
MHIEVVLETGEEPHVRAPSAQHRGTNLYRPRSTFWGLEHSLVSIHHVRHIASPRDARTACPKEQEREEQVLDAQHNDVV